MLALVLGSTATNSQPVPEQEHNQHAINLGSIENVRRLEWQATGDHFDPAQSVSVNGRGRHTSSYKLDASWNIGQGINYQWELDTHYPFPSSYEYTEAIQPDGSGNFSGTDGYRPSATGAMVAARAGARMKFLWMSAPTLLLSQAENISALSGKPNSYQVKALDTDWTVQIDPKTLLPIELSTTEADPLFGEVLTSANYSSWQNIDGVMVPARIEYRVADKLIRRELRNSIKVTLGEPEEHPDYTQAFATPRYSLGWNQAHWFISRIALASPRDDDQSQPVEFLQVAEGVYQVHGNSHHNLLIELSDGFVIIDAPMYPARSEAVLQTLKDRWPLKPVKHLILTHHHYDHSGGLATYAAAGVPITMHSLNRQFFLDALVQQGIVDANIEGVTNDAQLTISNREINLYEIPTSHADGLLGVYLPDSKLLLLADIYSPGQTATNSLWDIEALSAIRFLEVPVEHLVGVHGSGTHSLIQVEEAISN